MDQRTVRRWGKPMLRTSGFYGLLSLADLAAAALCIGFSKNPEAMAFARMFPWLFLGGGGIFLFLSRWLPYTGASEYYRIFQFLYHPGLLLLAAVAFWNGVNPDKERISSDIRLTMIAGGTLLCAGLIVLALIVWEHAEKKTENET